MIVFLLLWFSCCHRQWICHLHTLCSRWYYLFLLGIWYIKHLIEIGNITYYTRYADDIFIVYDSTKTTTEEIQSYADHIHKNLKFTITQENNKQINFLDILITRREQKLDINIYRKSTTTDTTINYLSNHPTEREIAAYRYYINRMNKLPLNEKNRTIEWQTILKIAHNNNFPANKI